MTASRRWSCLRPALLDGPFAAKRCQEWCNLHGMRYRVVEKTPNQKGFVLERRWVAEQTFGWLSHRGLHRERAGRLDVAFPESSASWPPTPSTIQLEMKTSNKL